MADIYDEILGSSDAPAQSGAMAASGDIYDQILGTQQEPYFVSAAKQLGSGMIEGTAGLAGLITDLNPLQPGGPNLQFPASKLIKESLSPYLAAEDPEFRYYRTGGEFLGPQGAAGVIGKGAKLAAGAGGSMIDLLIQQAGKRALLEAGGGALGAQVAEDLTGDTKFAPLAGAVAGAGGVSLLDDAFGAIGRVFKGTSLAENKSAAAKVFQGATDIDPDALAAEIARTKTLPLGQYRTTAELTGDVGAAQLQQELTKTGAGAKELNRRVLARDEARTGIVDALTTSEAVNPEAVGEALIKKGLEVKGVIHDAAKPFWKAFPKEAVVPVDDIQKQVLELVTSRRGPGSEGLNPRVAKMVDKLVNEVDPALIKPGMTADEIAATTRYKTTGFLQNMRSDILGISREIRREGKNAKDVAVATGLADLIDDAVVKNVSPEEAKIWKRGRGITALEKQTFKPGTVGGKLISEKAVPSTIVKKTFLGDEKSVTELKRAIAKDPALIEDYKRAVLDQIPTDAQGNFTLDKTKRFVKANSNGLKALLGKEHYGNLTQVVDDLKSQAKVPLIAGRASKGQSITAQSAKASSVLRDIVLESVTPGGGIISKAANELRNVANLKTASEIEKFILEAAMQPDIALELLKTPTDKRVMSLLERLKETATNAGAAAGKSTYYELSRTQEKPPEQVLDSAISRSLTPKEPAPSAIERTMTPATKKNISAIEQEIDSDPFAAAVYEVESGRNPKAKNPTSTAKGAFQLIDSTAKSLGVKDPFDLKQNYEGFQKLTAEHKKQFGDNPDVLYAAHYLGAPLLKKVLAEKPLTKKEEKLVEQLSSKVLPRFRETYSRLV